MMSKDESKETHKDQAAQDTEDWTFVPDEVKVDVRRAAMGGALAAVVTLTGAWLVGQATGGEARMLLETSLPSTRSFCGTMTLALGNILALMLTLLSLSASADVELKWAHYQRVKQIAWFVTGTLIVAVLTYLLLNVPLGQSDAAAGTSGPWYAVLYYATLAFSSLLGGALIAIALMLYTTVRDVMRAVHPQAESRLTRSKESESA